MELIPNDDWPGAGLLGVTIRLDDCGGGDERLIKVLSVENNSPAAIAALVPIQDYLLGTTIVSFASIGLLATTLNESCEEVCQCYMNVSLLCCSNLSHNVWMQNNASDCRNLRLQFRI